MFKLLTLEWLKYSRYRTMNVILGGYVLLLSLIFISFTELSFGPFELFSREAFRFPYVWQNVAFLAKFLNLYLCIAIIFMVSNEYSYRTIRQQIIDGLSRREVVLAKVLTIVVLSVCSTILVIVIGTIMGLMNSNVVTSKLFIDRLDFVVAHFVHAFTLMSLAMLFTFLLKRNGLTVLLFLTYAVFGEAIIRNTIPGDFTLYFPIKILTNLNEYPSIAAFENELQLGNDHVPILNALAGIGYGILFQLATYWRLLKTDL